MGGRDGNLASRGLAWALVQIPVLVVAAYLPVSTGRWPDDELLVSFLGAALVISGLGVVIVAALKLGRSLTPLPVPKPDATLQVGGLYRIVRHPIYAGAVMAVLGWSLWWCSWPGVLWTLVVFAFFDRKAAYEERWLLVRYPDYQQYRQRTAKFFPFVY
uniref:Isoprenylcysteine carboxylmethyltransferase family protein n=1 Tax=Thermoanaerobaculum aquaticum TaxID=1312852 RepID=A0A7C2NU80_9BACT